MSEPTCLSRIGEAIEAHEYASFAEFHAACDTMVSNAMNYNAMDTVEFILAAMMKKDLVDAQDELREAGHGVLFADREHDAEAMELSQSVQ